MVSVRLEPANLGFLADACEGGVGLSTGQPLVLHQLLRMKLQFDDGSAADAAGEVVWVNDTRPSGGLRFVGMATGSHERMRTWISALSPGSQDAAEPQRNINAPRETLSTAPQRPEPAAPEFPALTASRMQEAEYAGVSS